jgi:peptide/nickel transport system substrate-binding protein
MAAIRRCGTAAAWRRRARSFAGITLAAAGVLALAGMPRTVAAEPLRIGFAGRVTSLDPHFFVGPANASTAMHVFDRLVHRAPDGTLQPWLATGWAAAGDAVWEFRLRPGTLWHDGAGLTADDVAFTIGRVRNVPASPGGFGGLVRSVLRTEIRDPLTIRFHTNGPAPNLPGDLSSLAIISRHVGERATTADYNEGTAMVGSGPFRLLKHLNGDAIELARNDAWWGPRPAWDRVRIGMLVNSATRTAALLSGDADVIEFPNPGDLPRLRADSRFVVQSIEGLQAVFLSLDYSRSGEEPFVTDHQGRRLSANPFRDIRVRRALSLAINRQSLVERVMDGTATATGQWLPPGVFSHAANVPVPAQDLVRARRLLAEAGFPDGFRLTLHTPSDRLPSDSATAQAVAQMWTRIGVPTEVEALPFAVFSARAAQQAFSVRLMTWNSPTAEAGYLLVNVLGSHDAAVARGLVNNGRYANPALDALTDRALSTLEGTAREALLVEAVTMVADDVAMIPLYQVTNLWASRRGVAVPPRRDQRTLASDMQPARSDPR